MAKNYKDIYNRTGDSNSLNQSFYVKEELSKGVLAVPTGDDFLYTLGGSSVNSTQPLESSPHKTGRHNTSVIQQKVETSFTISQFFNIDTTLGAPAVAEIDAPFRVLMKSAFGNEDVSGGSPVYKVGDPDINFSIFEVGDMWSKQCRGAFVESANASFPGDGQAQIEFSGNAKDQILIGIAKVAAADYNGGNTITLEAGEGSRMKPEGLVMIIEADGFTRSDDTLTGAPRTITDVTGDVVTLSGAALADSDATGGDLFLCYYEPEAPVGINSPVIGLVGSFTLVGLSVDCLRSATINLTNNHELLDFCYGEKGLAKGSFAPAGRADVEVSIELNLNHDLVEYINGLDELEGDQIQLILGDQSGRHLQVDIPKVVFPIPEIPVPESGSIPITFTALANQTGLDQADEITYSFL
jgi:hypothetical protein